MAEYVLNSTYNPWLDPQHQKQRNKNQSKQDYKQQTKPKPKLTTAVSSSLTWHQDRQDSDGSLGGGGGVELSGPLQTHPVWKSFWNLGGEWDSKAFSSLVLDELMGYATLFYLATNFLVSKGRNLIGQCNLT